MKIELVCINHAEAVDRKNDGSAFKHNEWGTWELDWDNLICPGANNEKPCRIWAVSDFKDAPSGREMRALWYRPGDEPK